jgi:hypothetical protein
LSVVLTDSAPAAPLVGSPVIWTATASGDGSTLVYQFSVAEASGPYHMVQDFSLSNSFTWNPMQEGTYEIQVTVKDSYSISSAGDSTTASYTATSRIVGTSAIISPMANPLVALFSAPASAGASMYVQFAQQGPTPSWISTDPLPVVNGDSTNFIVAGMLPNTTYLMRYVLADGTVSTPLKFTTGSLPTNLNFPTVTVPQAPAAGTDLSQDMIFHAGLNDPASSVTTFTTDLAGNITWYYDSVTNNYPNYATSLAPNGTVYMLGGNPTGVGYDSLRQIDLAGDMLRQTDISAVNAELAAMGYNSITDFDHEAQLLPNGDTMVLANTPRIVNLDGNPTQYNGDMVIVLDQNFQVAWVWDSFQWLDTSRLPPLGEGPLDWLHANSVDFSPEDGDLIVSLRAQDWVIKIDYANGTGDGHVVWTLGAGGNFTIVSSGPDPWFSHQHDVRYVNDNTIVLFDDGNTRVANDPDEDDSRGQELVLNEQTMTATLVVNADLGNYSAALGSAQLLPNGNLAFTSGYQSGNFGETIEVLPDGTQTYVQEITGFEYRSYLTSSLYVDPSSSPVDAPLTAGASAIVPPVDSHTVFSGVVGTFTEANPYAPLSDFTAMIDWGDNSPQSVGTISQPGGIGTAFDVSGTHTYLDSGDYTITTYVTDLGGSKVTLTNTIDVEYPTIYLHGNDFVVSLDPTKTDIDITVDGVVMAFVASQVTSIDLFGEPGNDSLTVDSQYGLITAPINFYASAQGSNDLVVQQSGTVGPILTGETLSVGATYGTGTDLLTDGTNSESIAFFNSNPIFLSVPLTTLTIAPIPGASILNGDNAINFTEGSAPLVGSPLNPNWGRVTIDSFEPINFTSKTNLVINAGPGSDEISLNNSLVPTALTAITVDGSDPTASDTLVLNGTAAQDAINYTPGSVSGTGTVAINSQPAISFEGIENLSINGQGGNDNLTLTDGNGSDAVTLTPGAATDSGNVAIARIAGAPSSATQLTFSNLGSTGSFTLSNSVLALPDTLAYNGTAGDDTFDMGAATGDIILTASSGLAQIAVNTVGVGTVVLNGLGGQNVANLTGDASNITSTLGSSLTSVKGGGLGAVNLNGIEVVNLADGAGNVTFSGTAGQWDNIAVGPTGANTANVQDNGVGPMFNLTTTTGGTLTVGGNAGDIDLVRINGTSANDLITISGTGVAGNPTVAVNDGSNLLAVSVTSITAALVVNSGLGTDSVVVDNSLSAVTVPVTFIGDGGAGDSLTLIGGSALSDTYAPAAIAGSGISTLVFPSGTESVTFADLKPVLDLIRGPLVVDGTSANDVINYTAAPTDTTHGYVSVDNAEPVEFTNKTTLNINGQGGDDTITIFNPNLPTGLNAIIVNGDSPAGNVGTDTLVVNANNRLFTSADINTTSTTVLAVPGAIPVPINYANVGNVHIINSMDTLTGVPVTPIAAAATVGLNNIVVASFRFSDQPPAAVENPTDFLAVIDWGDGTVVSPDLTANTIVELALDNGVVNFQVLGSHTYTSQGSFTISVTIYDNGSSRTFTPTGGSVPVTITANPGALTTNTTTTAVTSAPITVIGTPTYQVEGITSTTLVATIVDPNPGASVADYPSGSISIDWGDGTPVTNSSPPIVVTQVGTQPNGTVFEVFAPHMYAHAGNDSVATTIIRSTTINNVPTPGSANVAVSNETVADAPLIPGSSQPAVNTDEATIYPTPEFSGTPSNSSGQLFSGPVAYFSDANTQSPVSPSSAVSQEYQATIDWGDGTPQSTGTVTYSFSMGSYVVSGMHTYATSGVNGGTGHYPIAVHVTDALPVGIATSITPSKLTITNVANVTDNPIVTTGILDPSDDNGTSNTDLITNVSQPNFYGTVYATLPDGSQVAEPYAHVELYGNGVPVGFTQANSDGTWSITSNNLAQGTYTITTSTIDQFHQTENSNQILVQHLVVDTTGPVITSLRFNRFNATLTVTFQDNQSGMDLPSLTSSALYHISASPLSSKVHVPRLVLPTSILYTPGASPTDPVTVHVVFKNGHTFRVGRYEVLISSGTGDTGIQDVAGNALDGNFYGTFTTGDGLPGGNFIAAISTFHRVALPFVAMGDGYVPPAKGIDPPAGSGLGVGGNKSHRLTTTHRNRAVIRQELAQKMSTRNAKLHAHDQALRHLAAETKAKRLKKRLSPAVGHEN